MNKKNEPLKITYMRALENYKKKNYKNAEDYCYKILSIDSYHFDSILMLARIAAINKNNALNFRARIQLLFDEI